MTCLITSGSVVAFAATHCSVFDVLRLLTPRLPNQSACATFVVGDVVAEPLDAPKHHRHQGEHTERQLLMEVCLVCSARWVSKANTAKDATVWLMK